MSRHLGFRLVGRKNGFARDVNAVYEGRRKEQYEASESLRRRQLEKLKHLLVHARDHCPYYRERFAAVGFEPEGVRSIADLAVLPPVSKEELVTHRDAMRSTAHPLSALNLNSSGGSTGLTVSFFQDRNWLVHQVAGGRFFDSVSGWFPGSRTAYLWGAPSDNEKTLGHWKENIKSTLTNTRGFDSFDMSDERMALYHRQLGEFRPHVMICYAGSVYTYAKFLESARLAPAYPLTSIVTSAETLTAPMRETIERVFRRPVFDRYGSREFGVIGAECEVHAGLHVNELDVVVECDRSLGEGGELLVTSLTNHGMPLIRYRIGDVGQLEEAACSCGRSGRRISRLLGRSSDFFTTAAGRKVHGEYFTHLFYGIDGVQRFQLVQETLNEFKLSIVRVPTAWQPTAETFVREELRKVFGESMRLDLQYVDKIASTASGKYRFTISKV